MGWVIDLDGVIWLGNHPIEGSAEAIARLRDAGDEVVFVTNNSYPRLATVEDKLAAQGIQAKGSVISSATIAASLVDPGATALVCAGPGVEEALAARGVKTVREGRADVVIVGFHRDFDYERMRIASRAVYDGAKLIATNDDATYPTPDGPIPGGGAILASIARATGVTPLVAGKPYEPAAEYVRARLGTDGVVVGDRPDTDGLLAVQLGYRFGLVLSGVTTPGQLPVTPEPDLVAPDLAHLVAIWATAAEPPGTARR